MARQKGTHKLSGKVGDMVYYHSARYGAIARQIGMVPPEIREQSPAFAKARKNNTEFGYGSRVGKLIRMAVRSYFPDAEEGATNSNLSGRIKKALAADTSNAHGQRRLTSENVALLKGFNWAERVSVTHVLRTTYSMHLNAEQGQVVLEISGLIPNREMKATAGATHVQLCLVLACVNYEGDEQQAVGSYSEKINLSSGEAISLQLQCRLEGDPYPLVIAGVGVQGYQEDNGAFFALQDRCVFEIGAVWAE